MPVTAQDVQGFFARYGWHYETTDDESVIVSGFVDAGDRAYAVIVSLSDTFVTFLTPYRALPEDAAQTNHVLSRLMRLNYDWPVAKLSLDGEETIVVSVELPVVGFEYEHFAMGLDLVTEAVERLANELPDLASTERKGDTDATP